VKQLHHVAHHDWKHAHPLDLSDEGLLEDLAKRGGEGADKLALKAGKPKGKAKAKDKKRGAGKSKPAKR
jgi:hypothetical protein